MNKLVAQVDLDGKKVEDVTAAWISANEARWKEWLK
jgi:glycine betaine/proline transport system substrate-binding protein